MNGQSQIDPLNYQNCFIPSGNSSQYIVVGIDGTGSKEWINYGTGENSHVFKFIRDFRGDATFHIDKEYFHGPSDQVLGRESEKILQDALNFIESALKRKFPNHPALTKSRPLNMFDVNTCKQSEYYAGVTELGGIPRGEIKIPVKADGVAFNQALTLDDVKIVIVGHSRGGLIATILAKMLSPVVKVYFLGLYDAVDRQPCLDGAVITNVKYVYHAQRHLDMNSRSYFENTSTQYNAADTSYSSKSFTTSHGGVGGDVITSGNPGIFGDDSCVAIREVSYYSVYKTGTYKIKNLRSIKFGVSIDELCIRESKAANQYIREGAKSSGLPIE